VVARLRSLLHVLLVTGSVLVLVGGGARSRPLAAARMVGERQHQATLVVRVISLGCGGVAVGSGVVVPGGRVLTNRHVVAGADYVEVRRYDGVRIGARVERVGRDVDLAVLWVGAGAGPGAEPRGRLQPAQAVTVLGHPAGGRVVRAAGRVTARARVPGGAPEGTAAWVDVPVAAGNSGGPVFAALGGDLVGVVFALENRTGLAGVIDGDTAAHLLDGRLPALDRASCEVDPD
jgi:S1-C subfamily serine protease